ncbi:hypothetical protein F2Q68_00000364 [Brassica cretica]|uniref:C-JID domain-containing protein n=1 Tax=Brassica cretica TaxID=69181 RepID=A0A8S9J5X5_BRACR|nr:hypothetical protein F2Q68_00000364 [Brassica cretica]
MTLISKKLDLRKCCSSLIKLPSLNGSTLQELDIAGCSCLDLAGCSTIGNAVNLQTLNLSSLPQLLELPSYVGKATNLENLNLKVLPANINVESLNKLDLAGCSSLDLAGCSIIGNVVNLRTLDISSSLPQLLDLPTFIGNAINLDFLDLSYCSNLVELPLFIGNLQKLQKLRLTGCCKLAVLNFEIQAVSPWLKKMSRLTEFVLKGCRKLVSLPPIPDSVFYMDASDCESLEILECSFHNPQTSSIFAVLPGGQVPAYFTHRAAGGGPLTIKLTENPLPKSMRFQACILLLNQEHLYTFPIKAEVTSSELLFKFKLEIDDVWNIGECGLVQHLEVPSC